MNSKSRIVDALHEWLELSRNRSMRGLFRYAREKGLSMHQIGTLFHLSRRRTSGVSGIGDDLGVTSAAASQMLERLVQSGMVLRSEDPNDRRAKRIVLTDAGEQIVRESTEMRGRWFADIAGLLSADERKIVLSALKILITRMRELDPAGEDELCDRPADISSKETTKQ
ncbi:MAG TPA: MarR family transcriptional regulator [Spirochaetia bacterium]|nr:MarR family transcriptional regulator [Spirochaetia bacterium]